jgi:hypothetical protein
MKLTNATVAGGAKSIKRARTRYELAACMTAVGEMCDTVLK